MARMLGTCLVATLALGLIPWLAKAENDPASLFQAQASLRLPQTPVADPALLPANTAPKAATPFTPPTNRIFTNEQGRKVEIKVSQTSRVLNFTTRYVPSRDVGRGRMVTRAPGANGRETVYTVRTFIDEILEGTDRVTNRVAATERVIHVGASGFSSGRGSYRLREVRTMEATAYHPMVGGHGKTATGRRAGYGIIAVDPRVIPLGTLVFVENYGMALAADTGGAIKGNKIDVCIPDYGQIRQWGRRKVRVHIFMDPHFAHRSQRRSGR